MNIAETMRGLRRRWYIVLPGVAAAVALAAWAWITIPPTYERTATQLLLPGAATLPETEEGTPNPFLYLGGLTTAADVAVSAVGAPEIAEQATDPYPGSEVSVTRDPTTSGPVVLITVTAPSDAAAADMIETMLGQTVSVLDQLQTQQNVADDAKVTVTTVAADEESELKHRDRMLYAVVAGGGMLLLALLLAAAIDGLVLHRRRRSHLTRVRRRPRPNATRRAGTTKSDGGVDEGVLMPAGSDAPAEGRIGLGIDPTTVGEPGDQPVATPAVVDAALHRILATSEPVGARRQGKV